MKWAPLLLVIALLLPHGARAQGTLTVTYTTTSLLVRLFWTYDGTDPFSWCIVTPDPDQDYCVSGATRQASVELPDGVHEITVTAADSNLAFIAPAQATTAYKNVPTPTPTPDPPTPEPTSPAEPPTNTALAGTQTAVATATQPTPTGPTPTAIPAVELHFTDIISTTRLVSSDLVAAWDRESDTSNLLIAAASIVLGFWLLLFLKVLVTWRRG